MKEVVRSCLKCCLRLAVILAVLAVFAGFTVAFTSVWHKCIITGAFAAYALVLLTKWGVVEWMQVHGCGFISGLASCDFCLSWWTSLVFCLLGYAVSGGLEWFGAAFVSTLVCRALK